MLKTLTRVFLLSVLVGSLTTIGLAQAQALNGQIEGNVTDQNGAVVPNATVVAKNIESGAERSVTTDASGSYRIPLLPLGRYQVKITAQDFKTVNRDGITLTAGQVATINVALEPGLATETIDITMDAPIADPGKIDVGRVMTTREVQDLPLVSRNPYNFSLLQANVVGRPNTEFGVPRVSANGYARRTNFQLDGNANTQANSAGLRLVPISETFIAEVQLVTNGFSAEFGNTPGLVMNTITPSGTNDIKGSAAYRFRRTPMSSRAFNSSPIAVKAPTVVDNLTFAVGAPIIKDRWHVYGGYEYVTRDFSGRPNQLVNITEANKNALVALGLPSDIFVSAIPASQKVNFFIFRTDVQLTEKHRLTGRWIQFSNFSPSNVGGGLNTLQRVVDLDDKSNSLAIQMASVFTPNLINEFRYQRAHRKSNYLDSPHTPNTVSVAITNVANFGPATNRGTISPIETMNQFQNNLTWNRGNHSMKFGGGFNHIYDYRRNDIFTSYTFGSLDAYRFAITPNSETLPGFRAACNQADTTLFPTDADLNRGLCYNQFSQSLGNAELTYNSVFYNFFAQDDWKVTPKLKINFGLRYDLYDIPEGDPNSPFAEGRKFKVDKNNFAPRLGVVYSLREGDRPTVIRGSAGIYYDTVYLSMYENAIQQNGTNRYLTVTRDPRVPAQRATSPIFGTSLPEGVDLATLGITTDAQLVSSDFDNLYALHFQGQIEQAISNDISITAGYIHSGGRHLPTYSQINYNLVASGAKLDDGRPIYAPGNRINSNYNNIFFIDSGANSVYDALTLQLNKRFSKGYQFNFNYTLSRARDNAPERNLQGVGAVSQQDPSNRDWDWAYGVADQRHTISASVVARPNFDIQNRFLKYIVNQNQFGFTAFAGSGETFPITTNVDLNRDGVGNDIPSGLERNAGRAPGFFNVDFRYSRIIPLTERFKLEFVAEATNIFNINSTLSYSQTTLTSASGAFNPTTGELLVPINNANFQRTGQESRQGQIGIKFIF